MLTRLIEYKGCQHVAVNEISLREQRGKSLLFDAKCTVRVKGGDSSGSDMQKEKDIRQSSQLAALQLDVERADILRVRFAEGEQVPANDTPMVVGKFTQAVPYRLAEDASAYTVEFGAYRVVLTKNPYSLSIFGRNGNRKFAASVSESNPFLPMDAFNIGMVSGGNKSAPPFFPAGDQAADFSSGYLGKTVAVESFELTQDEHIYGLGEGFTGLDKKYQTIDLWSKDALGILSKRMYKPIPFFVSSRGYGVFLNSHAPITVWVGSMSNVRTVVAAEDPFVDYYVTLGDTMKEAISAYTDLTGKPTLPPKWSFGFWLSKISYAKEEEVYEAAAEMRNRRLPFDVLHVDTHWFEEDWVCDLEFSPARFPDPERMVRRLAEQGVHTTLWQMPYVSERCKLYKEAEEKGFFARKDGKTVANECSDGSKMAVLDMSNPQMLQWWKDKFRKLLKMGIAGFKVDFGEGVAEEGVYANGMEGRKFHNLYPLLYNKAVYDVTAEFTSQPIIFARAAWAGSQRFPIHWGGDNANYYEQLVPQLTGGLSLGMSGFSFWSQDIGGFFDEVKDTELYVRWYQIGLFMSHARLHGVGQREPYRFGGEVEAHIRELLNLRYRLMPYIYSTARQSVKTSVPVIRALPLEFEGDRNLANIADEFMFGDSLLVAPITEKGGKREVYLPRGSWREFWSGEKLTGERWLTVKLGLDKFPLYIREGAIIPMGPLMQYTDEIPCDPITLLLYPGAAESGFEYYDDQEQFSIHLSESALSIGRVARHQFELQVAADAPIKELTVNGRSHPFKLEPFGFSFSCTAEECGIAASWK